MTKKIIVTGCNGQLGRAVNQFYTGREEEGLYGRCVLNCLRNSQTIFQNGCIISILH